MPFQLLYTSRAVPTVDETQLKAILTVSRERNLLRGVTGLLLYGEHHFFQILEGGEATVRDLFARIRADRRHEAVTVIATREVEARSFPDWSMGFRGIADPDATDLPALHKLRRVEDLDRLPANGDDLFGVMRAMYAANY